MLALKSEPTEEGLTYSASAQAELDYWERLNFSFDMDNDRQNQSDGNINPQRSRSVSQPPVSSSRPDDPTLSSRHLIQDSALLAHFAASAGLPPQPSSSHESYESLAHALRALQGSYPYIPAHPQNFPVNYHPQDQMSLPNMPSAPPSTFLWPPNPAQSSHQNPYGSQQIPSYSPSLLSYPYDGEHFPASQTLPRVETRTNASRQIPPMAHVASTSGSASPPEPPEQTEAERVASTEDKRRRNTAASARFRIKKKQRTLNLERSVSDLTGRAEELEREAAELRRENGWLKEIVMLKGRSLGAGPSSEIPRLRGSERKKADEESEDGSEDDSEDSLNQAGKGKEKNKDDGKGKGKEKEEGEGDE